MAKVFVDTECLRGFYNELVVKELALATMEGVVQSWIFEPPCDSRDLSRGTRRQNRWTTSHLHKIRWNHGHVSYHKLEKILSDSIPKSATVFVKGEEKSAWCKKYFSGERM